MKNYLQLIYEDYIFILWYVKYNLRYIYIYNTAHDYINFIIRKIKRT